MNILLLEMSTCIVSQGGQSCGKYTVEFLGNYYNSSLYVFVCTGASTAALRSYPTACSCKQVEDLPTQDTLVSKVDGRGQARTSGVKFGMFV